MKYPRTYHLFNSEGTTSDDKTHLPTWNLKGLNVIVTEKMDGENTTMTRDKIHARSLDSNNHPSRNWVKGLWGNIKHEIPEGWRICGENLYAKHSIHYQNLPSYFLVFSIWNENNFALSWNETEEWCNLLGLISVPVLYQGTWKDDLINFSSKLDLNIQEGFVIRNTNSFHYSDFQKNVAKWVRKGHVQTDKHWTLQPIIKNILI